MWAQIKILIWKNLLIKRRAPCSTLMELLVPVIILGIFAMFLSLDFSTYRRPHLNKDSIDLSYRPSLVKSASVFLYDNAIAFVPGDDPVLEQVRNDYLAYAPEKEEFLLQFNSYKTVHNYYQHEQDGKQKPKLSAIIEMVRGSPHYDYTIHVPEYAVPFENYPSTIDVYSPDAFLNSIESSFELASLQAVINSAILRQHDRFPIEDNDGVAQNGIALQSIYFPSRGWTDDFGMQTMLRFFQIMMIPAFMFTLSSLVSGIVTEKELLIKQTLQMMGMTMSSHYISWIVTYAGFTLISVLAAAIFINALTFKSSSFILIFLPLYLFALCVISFGCLVSSFFTKPKTAVSIGMVILSIIALIGLVADSFPPVGKGFLSLLFPTAFAQIFSNISYLHSRHGGITFDTVSTHSPDYLSYPVAILILFFDVILYLLLALYVDAVMPGEFNNPKPWYFPCIPSYWRRKKYSVYRRLDTHESQEDQILSDAINYDAQNESQIYEPDKTSSLIQPPSRIEADNVGVSIQNLHKIFTGSGGAVHAVNDLTIDMYRGQILSLLGHNGSGKSTTINMLCGLYPPTSGTAMINPNPDGTSGSLGICPQYNTLYPNLTVYEHLQLFSEIKLAAGGESMTKEDKYYHFRDILQQVSLVDHYEDKTTAFASTLSGGQMRKTCLAIALLHSPSVLVLDEPSSGMDINAQRQVWKLLTELKKDRVIILTTHSLEEAEIGDRIAILASGRLICAGTSLFLKQQYDVGYTFSLNKSRSYTYSRYTDPAQPLLTTTSGRDLHDLFSPKFPFLTLAMDTQHVIEYTIQFEYGESIVGLLEYVEANKQTLGIANYGLTITTLSDVFVRANDPNHHKNLTTETAAAPHSGSVPFQPSTPHASSLVAPTSPSNTKSDLVSVQVNQTIWDEERRELTFFQRLFLQFWALYKKRWIQGLRVKKQWLYQVVLPIVILALPLIMNQIPTTPNPIVTSINELPRGTPVPYVTGVNPGADRFAETLASSHPFFVPQSVSLADHPVLNVDDRFSFNDYLNETYHLYRADNPRYVGLMVREAEWDATTDQLTQVNAYVYTNSTAPFSANTMLNQFYQTILNAAGVNDVQIQSHIQPLEDVNVVVGLKYIALVSLVISIAFIPPLMIFHLVKERQDRVVHIQAISGTTPLAYWLSNLFYDLSTFTITIIVITMMIYLSKIQAMGIGRFIFVIYLYILNACIVIYILSFLFKKPSTAQTVALCIFLIGPIIYALAILLISLKWKFYSTTLWVGFIMPTYSLIAVILTDQPFWQRLSVAVTTEQAITGMVITFFIYVGILVFAEFCATYHLLDELFETKIPVRDDPHEDDDVTTERQQVLSQAYETDEYSVVVDGLRKVFDGALVAVNYAHFAIQTRSVFALLGANGAGKSTLISMLTSDYWSSKSTAPLTHTARIKGYDITKQAAEAWKHIGFCPQHDALSLELTGRQQLTLYANLRGVTGSLCVAFVDDLLNALGLTYAADRPSSSYSLGMRRRLSVGVALIGNPAVVFLDEPTTGVDPISRQQIYDMIHKTMKNRSVILTSHSMEEVEALSDRVAIMSRGFLRAIGTKQHLKDKLGNSFTINIQTDYEHEQNVVDAVQQIIPDCTVVEQRYCYLVLSVPRAKYTLPQTFTLVQQCQRNNPHILTYAIGQTRLDQVFLDIVRSDDLAR